MTDLAVAGAVLLQAAIVATFVVGLRRGNVAAAVNAVASLGAAVSPFAVEYVAPGVRVGPELPLWAATAGFLHSLGMLGLYESTDWWDHLTHTVSAGLVAALAYAVLVVAGTDGNALEAVVAPAGVAGATVAFVLVVGVFWELVELLARHVGERYDVEPVLVHYGRRDTALDLVFDVVGAAGVLALDVRTFVPVVSRHPGAATTAFLASAGAALVGSVLLAAVVVAAD